MCLFKNGCKWVKYDTELIETVEVYGHTMCVSFLNGESKQLRDSISRIEDELEIHNFVKINRSCMVNIDRIKNIKGCQLELYSGKKMIVSMKRKPGVRKTWKEYLLYKSLPEK